MKTLLVFVMMLPVMVTAQQINFEEHTTHGLPPARVLASADVNGDGIEDVFAFGSIQLMPTQILIAALYLGNGNGTFTLVPQQPFIEMPASDAIFIFDENGFPEFLVTQGGEMTQQGQVGKTHVYINDGAGNFTHHQELNGTFEGSLAAGKLNTANNDVYLIESGKVSNTTTDIFMYQLGSDNFFFAVSIPAILTDKAVHHGSTITFFDKDNDGDLDIFLTGDTVGGAITVLLQNNGNLNFEVMQEEVFDIAVWRSSVAVACFEQGNPFPWIVIAGTIGGGQHVSMVYRNDNGVFSFHQNLPGIYRASLKAGDFDKDGHIDLFAVGRGTGHNYYARVFRNDGNGNLIINRVLSPGLAGGDNSALVIDFNSDEKPDLVYTGFPSGINPEIHAFRNTTQTMSIDDFNAESVVMYPNPTRGQLYVELPNGLEITGIVVTDMLGRRVVVPVASGNVVNLGNFSSGIYLVTVQSDGAQVTKRVVKN